jgi:hypothetical protein
MNELTVIGAAIGGAAGYMLGVFVACSVLIPEANTCGLFAVFITFPLGVLGGGAAGTHIARRWEPPAVLGAVRLIVFIGLGALFVAILLRPPASRRRPAVSPGLTVEPASAAPVAAAMPAPAVSPSARPSIAASAPPSSPATTRTEPQGPLRVVEVKPLRVVQVTLRADPSDYKGRCPTTIRFHGRSACRATDVSYSFPRSDGAGTGQTIEVDRRPRHGRDVLDVRPAAFRGVADARGPDATVTHFRTRDLPDDLRPLTSRSVATGSSHSSR